MANEKNMIPQTEPSDPWDRTRRVNILPTEFGANDKKYFSVAGRGDWYKTGYDIQVPEPIADRIIIHNEAIRARQKLYNALRAEYRENMRYLT